jgi:hypothetical protein
MKWRIYKIEDQWQIWNDDGRDLGNWLSFERAKEILWGFLAMEEIRSQLGG